MLNFKVLQFVGVFFFKKICSKKQQISKSPLVEWFWENHAHLQGFAGVGAFCKQTKQTKQIEQIEKIKQIKQVKQIKKAKQS